MCELFASFFSSVFTTSTDPQFQLEGSNIHCLSSLQFTVGEVQQVLGDLDSNKGCGPDNIPPSVLKFCKALLSEPLARIFNLSISTGTFPRVLKLGHVVPIHKSGSKEDAHNYRPVVILSALSKTFERLVLMKISPLVRNVISPKQHGFSPGKSTVTNLVSLQDEIISSFIDRVQTDVIYLDFQKAFDKVSHNHLLMKLSAYGILGKLNDWFSSYLSDRKLMVKFAGSLSQEFCASSGVPQGSHLGPVLFCLFINDITSSIKTDFLLFADDIKIFSRVSSVEDCRSLQSSLLAIETWCDQNKMSLNVAKCTSMSFFRIKSPIVFQYQLQGQVLNRSTSVRDLGVILTHDLSAAEHVDSVCAKACRALGFLTRTSRYMDNPWTLKTLFCVYVRPYLEYCSLAWSPHQATLIRKLEHVQEKFLRLVGLRMGFNFGEVSADDMRAFLNLFTLEQRRTLSDAVFLFKILNNLIDAPELLSRIVFRCPGQTRSQELFARRHQATNYSASSTMERIQRTGNALSPHVDFFASGLPGFRGAVLRMLLESEQ